MFSANSSQVSDDKLFVEDVFSTYLYTGNGSTQTITNGIDLAGKGGMVWIKRRNAAFDPRIWDTVRGRANSVATDLTDAQTTDPIGSGLTSFNSNGFSLGPASSTAPNLNTATYASWTFREAPKFFDVVTYTGNGANRTIAHNLGSAPGMMIIKRTDAAENWAVYHRGFPSPSTRYGILNDYLGTPTTATNVWNSTNPTTSVFSVGTNALVNANGGTYVAYLYAHDTTADGIVQCGSFTTDGSANASVTLGWEPQWVMIKDLNDQQYYAIYDNMRGLTSAVSGSRQLYASTSDAEGNNPVLAINATGFSINQYANTNYVYIAIRRGPMRTPTLGTSVFVPWTRTGTGTTTVVSSTTFPPDLLIERPYASNDQAAWFDRLRGRALSLTSNSTSADTTTTTTTNDLISFNMNGITVGANQQQAVNTNGASIIDYNFRRAPSFMDVVCRTGNGTYGSKSHGLGVVPELIIEKARTFTSGLPDWVVWQPSSTYVGYLNLSVAFFNNGSSPATATTYAPISDSPSSTYVAYLFASAPGVSKVGNYTGNGSSQTINCGFAAGARFVMIKRTDSTGDWYVWDTARGIVAANDPHLSLNTAAAQVTTDDTIDPDSSGFVVNQVAATNVNVNAATYIYLAIA